MSREFDSEYFASLADNVGSEIAGIVMFDALVDALRGAEASDSLSVRQRQVALRQIAKQAEQIAWRYNLDHSIDFDVYKNVKVAA